MRNLMLSMGAAALTASALVVPTAADARKHYRTYYGNGGRTYCTRSGGTTGAVVGGVGGALIGNGIAGRGDKVGGVAGAFGGRAIDRTITAKRGCRR